MRPGAIKGNFGVLPNTLDEETIVNNCTPEPMSGCWLWTGTLNKCGYGKICINYKHWIASRASFVIYNKTQIPEGMVVMHKCDTRSCVNPEHLVLGTVQDNADDMVRKGRSLTGDRNTSRKNPQLQVRGSKSFYAKLNEEQVLEIKKLLATGEKHKIIADKFGVGYRNISEINRGKTWRHVMIDSVDASAR